ELHLAGMLIDAADGKVDWTAYPDQAAQELKTLIEAKLAGQPAEATAPPRTILPLLEALQQSVQAGNGKEASRPVKEKTPRRRARRTAGCCRRSCQCWPWRRSRSTRRSIILRSSTTGCGPWPPWKERAGGCGAENGRTTRPATPNSTYCAVCRPGRW